jgi:predicted DNA-binding protein
MAVKGKRVYVTLTWEAYRAYERLAELMDKPVATVIREVVEDAAGPLRQLADHAERLKAGDVRAVADLNALFLEVLARASEEGSEAVKLFRRRLSGD